MRKIKNYLLFILLAFHLCACGSQPLPGQPTPSPQAEGSSSGQSTGSSNHSGFDMAENPLAVERYLPLFLPEEPAEYVNRQLLTDTYGSVLYLFAVYTYVEAEPTYTLYTFDADTQETIGVPYHFTVPEDAAFTVDSMDVIDQQMLSFHLSISYPGEESAATYLYQSTPEGECLLLTDVLPEASSYPWNAPWGTNLVFDLPQAGTYIIKKNSDSTECQISLFNKDTLSSQALATLPTQCFALCEGQENIIYYSDSRYIVQYDMSTKTGTCLASLSDCGISESAFCHMLRTDEGQLVYVVLRGHTPGIYLLAEADHVADTAASTLHMVNLSDAYGSQYAISMASLLSTRSSQLDIEVETVADTDTESTRDRIIAEMISGKGPDLLLVSTADFQILAEKGLLLDITAAIETDTRQAMFGNVLDLGSVNDTLYAIPQDLSYHTLITSDTVWTADSWTAKDVMTLLEKTEHPANPILFFGRKATSSELLSKILLPDLENSPFLDFEKGICYFDSEAFIQILELCKQYGAPTLDSTEYISGSRNMLMQGEVITYTISLYDGLAAFSQAMNEYGTAVHIVGFPDSGTQILSNTYLVVNARTTQYAAVKEYLNFLLSYENQYTLVHPVRKDVFENRLTKDPVSGMYYMPLTLDNSHSALIQPKPNGDSYLEEYLAFLENAQPTNNSHAAVWDIIYQELNTYLNSGKSASDTAAVIQSRVQLYLDENAS